MISIATFSVLFIAVSAQQYQPQNFAGQAFQSTTPAPIIHPPAQVHYVNIGQDLAGDYKFGYDTGKGPLGQSFREESRLPDGTVKGAYGYVDASGQQRIVRYTAGKLGFMIDADEPAAGGASGASSAAAAAPRPAPQPVRAPTPSFQSFPAAPQTRFQHPPTPANFATPAPAAPAPQAPAFNPASQAAPLQLPALPQGNAALQYRYAQTAGQPAANPALAYSNYNPAAQFRPAPAPVAAAPAAAAAAPAPPTYSSQSIANQLSPSNPLSSFPQLPGVRLVQINPRPQAPQTTSFGTAAQRPGAVGSFNLAANSFSSQPGQASTPAPEEYSGPVIINAALLSYDIGAGARRQQQ